MRSQSYLVRQAALALALSALCGTALAQPAAEKLGPMPAVLPQLGHPDTVCFFASTMAAAAVMAGTKTAAADMRDGAIELSWRQMAFYIGKVSARYPDPQASEQVTTVSGKFMAKGNTDSHVPMMRWCLGSYLGEVNAFQNRLNTARKLAENGPGPKLAAISADTLDDDALCFALIGVALPQTMEVAKTDPMAARGVQALGRAQHFYMGRLLVKPLKVSIEQSIANAWDYTAVLNRSGDNTVGHAKVTACVDRMSQTMPGYFKAAEKGLPKDG